MIIMAHHPQQPKQQHEPPNSKTLQLLHRSVLQHNQAPPALKNQPRSNSTEARPEFSSRHQTDIDGKRSLIKNQLYLIEQLQLENANLRNERDHLQLENEELKFQLQMISYSNILSRPAPTPLNANQMEQLVGGDPENTNPDHLHHHQHQRYVAESDTPFEVQGSKSIKVRNGVDSIEASQLSDQVESLASHFKKPKKRGQSQHNDEQVSLYPHSESPSPPHETATISIPANESLRHSSTNAIANPPLHNVIIEDNDNYQNNGLFMNDNSTIDGTNAGHHNSSSFKLFGNPSPAGSSNKKSPTATCLRQQQLKQQQSADQVETAYIVKAGGPPQSRDLPQDDEEQRIKLVEQRYGDSEQVQAAAITIQRAFRKYQICKRFRTITEQLRHTYQSSAAATTATTASNKLPSAKRRVKDESFYSSTDVRPISTGSEKSIDASSTTSLPTSQQQQRGPASWESLGCAAERLVAAAATMKQILPTAINGIVKTPQSQQHQLPQQAFYYPPNGQQLVATNPLDHHNQRPTQVKLQTRTCTLENNRQLPTKQGSVVEAAISFQQLESMRKRQYRVGLNIFNKHPEKGVSFLVAHAFIDSSAPFIRNTTSYYQSNQLHFIDKQHLVQPQQSSQQLNADQQHPLKSYQSTHLPINMRTCPLCFEEDNLKRAVAHFLLHRKGLAKEKIGQYLGNLQESFNQDVLRYYLQEIDFYGLQVDVALRKFLSTFRLPGEAQKIEKIVDCFASRYVQNQQQQQTSNNNVPGVTMVPMQPTSHHPVSLEQYQQRVLNETPLVSNPLDSDSQQLEPHKNESIHLTKDEIFILTFAIIMLNTDLHSPSLKSTSRMSGSQFVNNLRGVFKSRSINESDLIEIYERVKANQITTTPDHVTHVMKVQQSLTITNFQRKKLPNFCVPHRRLVCFCRLFEIYDVNKKEKPGQHQREIFLFNDLLLVTKLTRRVRTNSTQLYTYRQSISLQGLYVQLFQTPHYHYGIRLCQRSNDETIVMFNARNELDCSRFADDLSESIAEMDEMDIIKTQDIVDSIHFKYLKRLRRHANLHNLTENNHSQRDEKRENKSNHNYPDKTNKSDNLEANDAATGSRNDIQMLPKSGLSLKDEEEDEERTLATRTSTSMKSYSKFSSMFNLSNVISVGGASEAKPGSASAAQQTSSSLSAKAFMTSALASELPLEASPPAQGRPQRLNNRANPATGSEISGQRRSSTSSVHSLDSGLFLSRDVSPNQSS